LFWSLKKVVSIPSSAGEQCCFVLFKISGVQQQPLVMRLIIMQQGIMLLIQKWIADPGDPEVFVMSEKFFILSGLYSPSRTIRVWDQDLAPCPYRVRLLVLRRACLSALLYKSYQRFAVRLFWCNTIRWIPAFQKKTEKNFSPTNVSNWKQMSV